MTSARAAGVLVAAIIGLLGSAAQAQRSPGPPRDRVLWILPPQIAIAGMPTGDLPHKPTCKGSTCSVDIEVTVDPKGNDPTGRTCAFKVDYVVVTRKRNVVITFNLVESGSSRRARWRDDESGEDGIRIYRGTATKAHFKNRVRRDETFSYERDVEMKDEARVYLYDINVDHDLGGGRCDVPDPIIVSRD